MRRAWAAGLVAAALFALVGGLRFFSFHSSAYDLGFFDQVIWNASQGHGLSSSFLAYSFFGEHFEPVLLIFLPIYWIHASPLWLLAAQSLALGLAVVPLFHLTLEWLGARSAWIAVLGYVLQLAVARTVAFDFHTEARAVPFVLLALLAAVRNQRGIFIAASLVPLICKEDGALLGLALGLFVFILLRRRVALLLAGISVAWGIVIVLAVMPAYRHGAAGDLILRYAYLGSSPAAILLHLFTMPWTWIGHLGGSGAVGAVAITLLGLGLLPLARPILLLCALIPLVPSLLSADPIQANLHLHYGIGAVPLLTATALLGWQRLSSLSATKLVAPAALLVGSGAIFALLSPIPNLIRSDSSDLQRRDGVLSALRRIPPGATLAASTNLVPALSERVTIDEIPCGAGTDEWVAVDARTRPSDQSLMAGAANAIAALPERGYRPVAASAGVTVWTLPQAVNQAPADCSPSR